MPDEVAGVRVRIGDEPTPTATHAVAAGRCVWAVTTAVPEHEVAVTTTYSTAPGKTATVCTIVVDAHPNHAKLDGTLLTATAVPVLRDRHLALLDHASRVQDALTVLLRRPIAVDVDPATLDALAG